MSSFTVMEVEAVTLPLGWIALSSDSQTAHALTFTVSELTTKGEQ